MGEVSRGSLYKRQLANCSLKRSRNAGALIYSTSSKRFLFLLRDSLKKHRSTWGLVGGKIEKDERPLQALLREAKEELSIDFSYNKIVPIETFTSEQLFIYYTFLIVVDTEFVPTLNLEHRGYAWVHLADYPTPLHPGVWKTFNFNAVMDKLEVVKNLL